MSDDPIRDFAEELIDDLRIAEQVRERDADDDGERIDLDNLVREVGLNPDEES